MEVHRGPTDGKVKNATPPPAPLDLTFHRGERILHVEFHQQGLEIAVIDVVGRISIHNATQGINRMVMIARRELDPATPDEAVIAMKWMIGSRPVRHKTIVTSRTFFKTN